MAIDVATLICNNCSLSTGYTMKATTWSISLPLNLGVLAIASTAISIYVSRIQPKPYMDEIFHVPQAVQYCNGNFSSWDPMITTLPGLYLMSVGLMKPWAAIFNLTPDQLCSTFGLRIINLLFLIGNYYLLYIIYQRLHPLEKGINRKAAITALTLALFPVLYFFTFLYYTDAGSTFFVLMMYCFHLHGYISVAALMGTIAIVFRQTNIVWVVYVAGNTVSECVTEWMELEKKEQRMENMEDTTVFLSFFKLLYSNLKTSPLSVLRLVGKVIQKTCVYILVGITFMSFIYINGSIVVGAKTHHEACLNFPQIFYFLSLTLFFCSPYLITPQKIKKFLKFSIFRFYIPFIFILISFLLVYKFTHVHEYLLADNRHYTFYVWSKIFSRHQYVRFLLLPVYYYAAYQVTLCLKHKVVFWKIVFIICLLAATVPQKLLEFRYFILPYLLFRLNLQFQSWIQLMIEFIIYTLVNAFTIVMFTNRPFRWDSSDDVQRFMW